jgi:hypothetical protein
VAWAALARPCWAVRAGGGRLLRTGCVCIAARLAKWSCVGVIQRRCTLEPKRGVACNVPQPLWFQPPPPALLLRACLFHKRGSLRPLAPGPGTQALFDYAAFCLRARAWPRAEECLRSALAEDPSCAPAASGLLCLQLALAAGGDRPRARLEEAEVLGHALLQGAQTPGACPPRSPAAEAAAGGSGCCGDGLAWALLAMVYREQGMHGRRRAGASAWQAASKSFSRFLLISKRLACQQASGACVLLDAASCHACVPPCEQARPWSSRRAAVTRRCSASPRRR